MSNYDLRYNSVVKNILENGIWDTDQKVRTKWADETPAHTISVICEHINLDNTEVPILTTKKIPWQNPIHELLWFYVKRTSDASYLDENKIKFWKPWINEQNNIGKAYGYQLGKPIMRGDRVTNQVENLITELKSSPASRRHVISLWDVDDLSQMTIAPCVWHSQWLVKSGKLHLIVGVRSNDIFVGNPFNVFQYYVLQRMICQVTGYELGTLNFNINDAHIYDRHIDLIKTQIEREPRSAPKLIINPDVKNFDDFTIDDFKLVGYDPHPFIKAEVAI